jgi:hypothetical protein
MTGKKSRPYAAAVASIFPCSARRYRGIRGETENDWLVISFPLPEEFFDAPDDAVLVAVGAAVEGLVDEIHAFRPACATLFDVAPGRDR